MQSLNQFNQLVKELTNKQLTIASAESYTGGLFSSNITKVAGASKVFVGGVTAYATRIKIDVLKVSEDTIDKYGVISKECALEMALNVRQLFKTDIGVSFTGVAGPDRQDGNEVGICFIGISIGTSSEVLVLNLGQLGREEIQSKSVAKACEYLLDYKK